jgi:hypothetical protein
MRLRIGPMWRAGVLTAALAAAALLAAPAFTQEPRPEEATFRIEPESQNVAATGSEVSITVKLDDAVNLAAWEFRFAFDPDVLTYKDVTPSGFLAQSGRTQQCLSPEIMTGVDIAEVELYGVTTVQYGCNTPGQSLPGVNGDGQLAIVRFTPKAPGVTPITCIKLEVTDALSSDTPRVVTKPCTAVVKVTSADGGGGGGSNNNQLEPTPTPNVRVLTPTAIPNAVVTQTLRLGDGSGTDPSAPGAPGSGSSAAGSGSGTSSGSGSASGSGSSGGRSGVLGGIQSAAGAPIAGYGMARDAFFTLSLWAQLTLVAGLLIAGTGAVMHVRNKR